MLPQTAQSLVLEREDCDQALRESSVGCKSLDVSSTRVGEHRQRQKGAMKTGCTPGSPWKSAKSADGEKQSGHGLALWGSPLSSSRDNGWLVSSLKALVYKAG